MSGAARVAKCTRGRGFPWAFGEAAQKTLTRGPKSSGMPSNDKSILKVRMVLAGKRLGSSERACQIGRAYCTGSARVLYWTSRAHFRSGDASKVDTQLRARAAAKWIAVFHCYLNYGA
jgi:hypothetical protein